MASALTFPKAGAPGARNVQISSVPMRVVPVLVTFSGTYSTGGEAFDPAATNTGLVPSNTAIQWVEIADMGQLPGVAFTWDKTNKKIRADTGGGELGAASAALAGKTVTVFCSVQ